MLGIDTLCTGVTWMTLSHRMVVMQNLENQERELTKKVEDLIQVIAQKKINAQISHVEKTPANWVKTVIEIPVTLVGALLLDQCNHPLFQGASLVVFGMFLMSMGSLREIQRVEEELKALREEVNQSLSLLNEEKVAFDIKVLTWEKERVQEELQLIVTQINKEKDRESYLNSSLSCSESY